MQPLQQITADVLCFEAGHVVLLLCDVRKCAEAIAGDAPLYAVLTLRVSHQQDPSSHRTINFQIYLSLPACYTRAKAAVTAMCSMNPVHGMAQCGHASGGPVQIGKMCQSPTHIDTLWQCGDHAHAGGVTCMPSLHVTANHSHDVALWACWDACQMLLHACHYLSRHVLLLNYAMD